jgi:hypothetical protein
MKLSNLLVSGGILAAVTTAGFAHAEEAATPAAAAPSAPNPAPSEASASEGHASGLMVQARVQSQAGLLSLGGGSGFLLGYQGPSYSLGLGLGLTRVGVSAGSNSGSLTLLQLNPTAIIDVWHSADGRARANLVGSVGYGRASLSATTSNQDCTTNAAGNTVCTTSNQDSTASATFIPVTIGFGGDYFLSRNFALGAEFGVQALFVTGLNSSASGNTSSVDASANAQFGYGALRATFVLGD